MLTDEQRAQVPAEETLTRRLEAAIVAAQESELRTGLWTSLTVAQWALESAYGTHAPGNNPFGIKFRKNRHKQKQLLWTHEVVPAGGLAQWKKNHPELIVEKSLPGGMVFVKIQAAFAKFDSLAEAFADHAWLLQNGAGYKPAWEAHKADREPFEFIGEMAEAYATDPNYAQKVNAVIVERELLRFDRSSQAQQVNVTG